MKRHLAAIAAVSLLLAPALASADFRQSSDIGRAQVANLTPQQQDALNSKVFTDAWLAAKIIGYDRSEIEQLKADVRQLRDENAQLRAQVAPRPAVTSATQQPSSDIDARVSRLEDSFNSLQGTLMTVVTMLTRIVSGI